MWVDVFLPTCVAVCLSDVDRTGDGKKPYNSEGPRNSKFEPGISGCFKLVFVNVGG